MRLQRPSCGADAAPIPLRLLRSPPRPSLDAMSTELLDDILQYALDCPDTFKDKRSNWVPRGRSKEQHQKGWSARLSLVCRWTRVRCPFPFVLLRRDHC